MQAFATFAIKGNIRVTKNTVDQFIHGWLFEPTSLAGFAAKGSGPFNLFT
jgi:hypothetical protein